MQLTREEILKANKLFAELLESNYDNGELCPENCHVCESLKDDQKTRLRKLFELFIK